PQRYRRVAPDDTRLGAAEDSSQWPDGDGYVVGAVGKRHRARGHEHQDAENPYDGTRLQLFSRARIGLDAGNGNLAQQCHDYGDSGGQQVTVASTEIETDVRQPLQYRHQRDRKSRQENINGDITPSPAQGVRVAQNKLLHTPENY